MISVIMPVRLTSYKTQAKEPIEKFKRAVLSVLNQTYKDFELLIISDGCNLVEQNKIDHDQIKYFRIEHSGQGEARNKGLQEAKGDIITYLDADDCYGKNHLEVINKEFTENLEWIYFNDWILKNNTNFEERFINIRNAGQCGTSNIAHKNIGVKWLKNTRYGYDDYFFIKSLMQKSGKNKRIITPFYYVMHIPKKYDI
jgi:glycosyltransferase involved in cell wall biosynthesis